MAVIYWADGFEHYGAGATDQQGYMLAGAYVDVGDQGSLGSAIIEDGTQRTGSRFFRIDNNDSNRLRKAISAVSRVGVAFGCRFNNFDDTDLGITFFSSGGGTWGNFQRNTDGTWSFRVGAYNGTVQGTSIIGQNVDAWHHIEAVITLDDSNGSYELRIDGEVALSGAAIDFGDGGTGTIASVGLGTRSTAFNFSLTQFDVDDLVIHDGSEFLGPVRVRTYYPDADASPSDWTPTGAASGAEAVDDTEPDDDTTYIQAANVNDTETFTLPTLDSEIGDIEGVYIGEYSKQVDAGTTNIRVDITSGASTTQGDARPLTPSYSYGGSAFNTDPNTSGGKFTKTTLEAASIKLVRTA